MDKEEELLEQWRELTPEKQQKVWQFVQILKSESQTTPEAKFIPQTPLSKSYGKSDIGRSQLDCNCSMKRR